MMNYSAQWIDKSILVIAVLFATLYMIKMIGWLTGSEKVQQRIMKLYNKKIKKIIYFLIFIFTSFLLLTKLTIVEYIVAVLAIGALYDYFFSLFPEQSAELVSESIKNKSKMWFFGVSFPILLAIGLILYFII